MPVVAVMGVIALIGFVAARAMQDAKHERDFRAANGWSLDEVAAELTAGFDRDGDGRLAYDAVAGVRTLGESQRTTTKTWSEPLRGWFVPAGTLAVKERRTTYTIEPLLRKADADGDGVVTRAELQAVLRAYDPDGNGRLTAADRARVTAELSGVVASTETRTVGVLPPQPAPATSTGVRR
ncbi:MAG: hypothetical protein JWM98_1397 [Thermoleophilia bacterium]|nr:hypothetical protein [Thermoleophilia bacterium]